MRNNYSGAIILSTVLHGLLIAALVYGGVFAAKEVIKPNKPAGETIKAVAIDPVVVKQQALKLKREREAVARAEKKRKDRLEKEAKALELKRKKAEERIKRLEKERKLAEKKAKEAKAKEEKRLKEQKIAEEKAKVAKEKAEKLEVERQAKLEEKKKAEEAAKKAKEAEEAARKKAAEEKAKAEAARKEREEQEAMLNDMFAGIDEESAERQSAKSQLVADEVARNAIVFQKQIEQRLRLNSSMLGKQCLLSLNLANNGLVLSVNNTKGDTALCNAAKAAVLEVQQFPMPDDPDVINEMKKIRLVVEPK